MKINFTKMHGIGNDYIYVNCLEGELDNPSEVAIAMSPRHFSVGADGLVMICHSDSSDAKMRMFNADGSEGKMCGNAIRCVGKYLYDNKIVDKSEIDIETLSGIKHLSMTLENGIAISATVNMGKAIFEAEKIPALASNGESEIIASPLEILGISYPITCVSMGNPHAITFLDSVCDMDLIKIGPNFENHTMFPERVNTEFVKIINESEIEMRVWERGSGETFACGTGACASVAAAVKNGYCKKEMPITVHLLGGDLTITCKDDYTMIMQGPCAKSYDGVYEI